VSGRKLNRRVPLLLLMVCAGVLWPSMSPVFAAPITAPVAAPVQKPALAPPKGAYIEHGITMHYYAGLFEQVARNRGMRLRTDVDGYASRQNCGELGRVVLARIRSRWTGAWGPWRRYQIVDCSARRDVGYHRKIGLILEVDYRSAVKTGFAYQGRSAVEVAPYSQ
jgi:hypothetical protein